MTWQDVSKWALDVVVREDLDELPDPIEKAVHALFELHDGTTVDWAPDEQELRGCKIVLKGFIENCSD